MNSQIRTRRGSAAVVAAATALVLVGCTSTTGGGVGSGPNAAGIQSSAARVVAPPDGAPGSTPASPPVAALPTPVSSDLGSAAPSPVSSPASGPSKAAAAPPAVPAATVSIVPAAPPAVPAPTVSIVPAANASGVSPVAPVVVSVATGKLGAVAVTNPEGRSVRGAFSADRRIWTSAEALGYDRAYTVRATSNSSTGAAGTSVSSFTTLDPGGTSSLSFFPGPNLKTIGVGQPLVVQFDQPPADRATAEKALVVTTVPVVKGSWSWIDDTTAHYRPEKFWKAGTKISVAAKIYGVDLGDGMYGEGDRTLNVTVGQSKVAKIDDATKQMQVFIDGKLIRTVPVSMGREQTVAVGDKNISLVTPSGIYVVQEKYAVKRMKSASYGLPADNDLGYDKNIPLAVRLSNEGIFVHSAPWSVDDQGVRNVSHGCININPAAAQWFYDNFSFGDVVEVTGTSTELAPTDGFGDWNVPWAEWQQGSAS